MFIAPPSMAELARAAARPRHRDGGGHRAAAATSRETEVAAAEEFDHVVVNDDAERAAAEVAAIIEAQTKGKLVDKPRIDELLPHADGSRYALVMIAAKRARQINNYYHSLGENTLGSRSSRRRSSRRAAPTCSRSPSRRSSTARSSHESPGLSLAVSGRLPPMPRRRRTVLVGVTRRHRHLQGRRAGARPGQGRLRSRWSSTTEAAQRFVMPLTFAAVSQAPVLDDESAWQASGGWFQHIEAARTAQRHGRRPGDGQHARQDGRRHRRQPAHGDLPRLPRPRDRRADHELGDERAPGHAREPARARGARRGGAAHRGGRARLRRGGLGPHGRRPRRSAWPCARAFAGAAAGPLAGKKVVVTSGGTRERIDAVRFIGNRSSGKMGRAVADEAYLRGAARDARHHAAGRRRALRRRRASRAPTRWPRRSASTCATPTCSSWPRPSPTSSPRDEEGGKIERGERESLTLELVRTVDILAATARPGLFRVGFAAEAGPRLDRARAKKAAKGVDLLVFNDILAEGVGIGSDENEITIITPHERDRTCRAPARRPARAAIVDQIETGLRTR